MIRESNNQSINHKFLVLLVSLSHAIPHSFAGRRRLTKVQSQFFQVTTEFNHRHRSEAGKTQTPKFAKSRTSTKVKSVNYKKLERNSILLVVCPDSNSSTPQQNDKTSI